MKMKMRPRYYCDHCGRGNGSPSAMRRHEESCTANPFRHCRFCGTESTPELMAGRVLILAMDPTPVTVEGWKARMDRLRVETDDCPGCILAAIRQSGVQRKDWDPDPDSGFRDSGLFWKARNGADSMLGFNFKDEKQTYLERRAESRYRDRYY